MPAFDRNRALTLLRDGVGDRLAEFRRGQAEAIEHVVTGAGRLLVVQKTGWGKSFVYFIATKMLRESGMGPTLLVSPLLALMRNQIAAAERMGVNAETINSNNPTRWHEIEEALRHDQIDILLIAPERLANDRFRDGVLAEIAGRAESSSAGDDGHCQRPGDRRPGADTGPEPRDLPRRPSTSVACAANNTYAESSGKTRMACRSAAEARGNRHRVHAYGSGCRAGCRLVAVPGA